MAEVAGNIHEQEEWRAAHVLKAGSIAEGIVGIAAGAIAIVALAGVKPELLLAVAIIAAGAALVLEGGAIVSRYATLLEELSESRFGTSELGSGVTTQFIGGVTGIILGILMLINIHPFVLASIAVIVYGATLLISSGATSRMSSLMINNTQASRFTKEVTHQAVYAAAGAQILVGIGVVILGILGLTGFDPLVLSLVAVLAVGVSDLLSGSAVAGRIISMVSPRRQTAYTH